MTKILALAHSKNSKTGDIAQTYSTPDTCPERCPFKCNGCYGLGYFTRRQWKRAETEGMYPHQLRQWVLENVPEGALIRHNITGDIAIQGTSEISPLLLGRLLEAFKGRRAWSYTHCEITEENAEFLRVAQDEGFVISFSCETLEEVDRAIDLGCKAVLTVPKFPEGVLYTPKGRRVVPCPAQVKQGVTCKSCNGLCGSPNRETVVMFEAHGQGKEKACKAIEQKITFHGLKVTGK